MNPKCIPITFPALSGFPPPASWESLSRPLDFGATDFKPDTPLRFRLGFDLFVANGDFFPAKYSISSAFHNHILN